MWLGAAPHSKSTLQPLCKADLDRSASKVHDYSDQIPGACVATLCPLGACALSFRCACESFPNSPTLAPIPPPAAPRALPPQPRPSTDRSLASGIHSSTLVTWLPHQSDAMRLLSPWDPSLGGLSVRSLHIIPASAFIRYKGLNSRQTGASALSLCVKVKVCLSACMHFMLSLLECQSCSFE